MTNAGPDRDTQLGGERRDFPSTCWSRFVGAFEGEGGASALEELASRYWKPIYAYIRMQRAKSNEDAKDLTQEFFAWVIESGFISRADPDRGRFRAFVKVALKHFLSKDERDARAQRRGGGRRIVSIDSAAGALPPVDVADPAGRTPEEVLDEAWKNEVLTSAQRILEQELLRDGQEVASKIFRDYYLGDSDGLNYREVAARHGVDESDVLNHLRNGRKRYREILKRLVAETVGGEADLLEEWRSLFGEARE